MPRRAPPTAAEQLEAAGRDGLRRGHLTDPLQASAAQLAAITQGHW